MKYSFWTTDDYPVYMNPTFPELAELAQSKWDTIRICVDGNNIGLASGYGNTHDSITKAMVAKNLSRGLPETYILFKDGGDYWFNLEDVSGERVAPWKRVVREYFTKEHGEMIHDLIVNSH